MANIRHMKNGGVWQVNKVLGGSKYRKRRYMSKKIICGAANFGYGPVSKLLSILRALPKNKYDLCFVGYGAALELARHFPFSEVVVGNVQNDNLTVNLNSASAVM
jgi:hypothetical protein